jgi:phage terminase large subunit-like protein
MMDQSYANYFLNLPVTERRARLSRLSNAEQERLRYVWSFWRRPNQTPPAWNWRAWLILAGRGFGKSRTGAETVRQWVKDGYRYVNLIGATADDARDIMIEGESGILAICPKDERPVYVKNLSKLSWPNGASSLIFTADSPERLRGKQHEKLWEDELAAWRYPEAHVQAMLGMRLGDNPQTVITTTPKPTKDIKELLKDPTTAVTRGSTYDNRANLAPAFFAEVIKRYEGTRLGRQELNAELLEDVEGALWKWSLIEQSRVTQAPKLRRIVVADDPAVTAHANSDETGIIAAGLGDVDGHGYVLADASGIYSPLEWAKKTMTQYDLLEADCVVAEVNNGGDLVEANLRAAGFRGAVQQVRASRGKQTRAEPLVGLYEQGKIHHVGVFADLESQMTTWDAKRTESPDRVDALVWAFAVLMDFGATWEDVKELGHIDDYVSPWR